MNICTYVPESDKSPLTLQGDFVAGINEKNFSFQCSLSWSGCAECTSSSQRAHRYDEALQSWHRITTASSPHTEHFCKGLWISEAYGANNLWLYISQSIHLPIHFPLHLKYKYDILYVIKYDTVLYAGHSKG